MGIYGDIRRQRVCPEMELWIKHFNGERIAFRLINNIIQSNVYIYIYNYNYNISVYIYNYDYNYVYIYTHWQCGLPYFQTNPVATSAGWYLPQRGRCNQSTFEKGLNRQWTRPYNQWFGKLLIGYRLYHVIPPYSFGSVWLCNVNCLLIHAFYFWRINHTPEALDTILLW